MCGINSVLPGKFVDKAIFICRSMYNCETKAPIRKSL